MGVLGELGGSRKWRWIGQHFPPWFGAGGAGISLRGRRLPVKLHILASIAYAYFQKIAVKNAKHQLRY